MKKLGLLFTTVLMIMLFAFSVSAETKYTEGYYTYTVENGEATITSASYSISGDVVIPETLGGYPVVSINYDAFMVRNKITSVIIPDSVRSIGYQAFRDCDSLESIIIPDSVESIGYLAFESCDSLTNVTIPDSITRIASDAFRNCKNLEKITVDENNANYSSDSNGVLFNKTKTILIASPSGITTTSYIIPDSVGYIESRAFYNCDGLVNITFNDKRLYDIRYEAFYDCDSLESVTIPEGVRSIGTEVFACCDNLISITVDENNTNYLSDSRGVLFNKNKTELIQYPVGNDATSYDIPDTVTKICTRAFYSGDSLKSVTIPDSVTSISSHAFYNCTNLKNINIPDGVTSIPWYTFYNCINLKDINIPDGVTSIGSCAFEGCESLDNVIIPDGITKINGAVFSGCTSLMNIAIPDSVTTIGHAAFSACAGLVSIRIPDSVTKIDNYAFDGCNRLKSIKLPDGLISIGNSSFANCTSLESVNIPDSVTTICYAAFRNCSRLTNIAIPKSVTETELDIFSGCEGLKHISYEGSEEEAKITIGTPNNLGLHKKKIHYNFNSETDITESITASTCLAEGSKATVCSCGYIYSTETLPLADCSFTAYTSDNNATCTLDGTKTAYCDYGCGNSNTVTDEGSALGHAMGEFVVTKEATCTVNGEERSDCSRCDYYETKELIANNHKDENLDGYCEHCKEFIADKDCICICHAKGIGAFIYRLFKIIDITLKTNLVGRVFGISDICVCGIRHW